jgi:hypothetical protein
VYSDTSPYEGESQQHSRLHVAALGWLLAIVAVCAGVGWLYLLRGTGALAAGPAMHGALPLQELAGQGAQPLLRMAAAWLPSGFAAALALGSCTRMRAAAIALGAGLLSFALLFPATATSEAVEYNERLSAHLVPALQRTGLWTAVALVVIGSLPGAAAGARARRRPRLAATTTRATSSSAA